MDIKKLTEDEVNEIKNLSNDFNQLFTNLGIIQSQIVELKTRRDELYDALGNLRDVEKQIFVKLKEKYGEGVVDINTGEFKSEK